MKMKLSLAPHDGGPFNNLPAREVELETDRILCNDVIFPWEYNPHNVCLWIVGNEFGVLGAAWGNEQDALDEMADADLLSSCANDEEHADHLADDRHSECECTFLGNASEPYYLVNVWMQRVDLNAMDKKDCVILADARGRGQTTVYAYAELCGKRK